MSQYDPQQPMPQQPIAQPAPGVPGAMGAPLSNEPSPRRASVLGPWGARIVLIVVAACALVSVVFILFGSGGDTISRVVTTDFALIAFALLVWLDTVVGSYRPEWFEFTSLAVDAYLLLLWILIVWTFDESAPAALALGIWGGLLCLIFVRGMLALTDLVRYLYSLWTSTVTRALAYVSGCSLGVLAVMVTIPTPTPFNDLWDVDYYGRIVAAIAVIGGVALVLIPLWGLLSNRAHGGPRRPVAYGVPAAYPGAGEYAGYSAVGQPTTPGYPPASGHAAAPVRAGAPAPAPGQPGAQQFPPQPASPGVVAPSPSAPTATPQGAHPPLAWPRLSNGTPVPAGPTGAPDFAAVPGASLAWPTFLDGTPVPARADGTPLYR